MFEGEPGGGRRLDGDLAEWYPLLTPVGDYAEEADECEHIQGDMRSVRLGRGFDCVLLHAAPSRPCTIDIRWASSPGPLAGTDRGRRLPAAGRPLRAQRLR
jgi:hypothetical protein